ncbi:hypothetical protein AB205_0146340 [Aquarana catesbeiana]|uniref:Uncharacterized protein n=1 Tax=Aquarana catesbeiana TaxID=8400 RepID=A0A2G9RSL5_AQUCT|nr:hypothetical protein AB205_0146340 [Aquarana catesbeiana]
MAERLTESSAEESPEPQPSTSWRRYKATNMAFEEMVEMVSILRREDYVKSREPEQYWQIKKLLKKSKYLLCVPIEILNLHADPYFFRLYSIVRKDHSL